MKYEVLNVHTCILHCVICHIMCIRHVDLDQGNQESFLLFFSFGCYYLSMKMMMMIIIMIRRCKTRLDERSTSQDRSGLCVGRVFLEKT